MDFDTYLDQARETAIYPPETAIEYLVLGLASEVGEVAGGLKKHLRGDAHPFNPLLELGDVLWYVTMIADEFGYSLSEVAQKNVEKLRDRADRGQLRGSGDER